MTLPTLTREWCETGTKTDPGAAAALTGFVAGQPVASAHVNFELNTLCIKINDLITELNAIVADESLARLRDALYLHPLDYVSDDTGNTLGVTMVNGITDPYDAVVAVKVNSTGVALTYEDSRVDSGGVVASVTSAVRDAATNGSRIVVIGTGGNLASYSDNAGGSWSASVAGIGGAVQYLVYMPTNALVGGGDRFLCGGSGTGSVYRNDDAGTGTWDSLASAFPAVLGLAVLGGATANAGYCVALGASGSEPRMSVLTDGGNGADFNGAQTPPNAATADEPGSIAGTPLVSGVGAAVYHVMRCDSGARLRTNKTVDGFTWTASTTIEAPIGTTFDSAPRLMLCQSTGLAVIAAPLANGTIALYASLDVTSWTEPMTVKDIAVTAFAVAGGRLFLTSGATIWSSSRLV